MKKIVLLISILQSLYALNSSNLDNAISVTNNSPNTFLIAVCQPSGFTLNLRNTETMACTNKDSSIYIELYNSNSKQTGLGSITTLYFNNIAVNSISWTDLFTEFNNIPIAWYISNLYPYSKVIVTQYNATYMTVCIDNNSTGICMKNNNQ